jgi:transposase
MDNMTFREFVELPHSDMEVANLYFHNRTKVREIAATTGKSIGEIYRIIRRFGNEPNRMRTDQANVIALADAGLSAKAISDFTDFSARHVRNLLNSQ